MYKYSDVRDAINTYGRDVVEDCCELGTRYDIRDLDDICYMHDSLCSRFSKDGFETATNIIDACLENLLPLESCNNVFLIEDKRAYVEDMLSGEIESMSEALRYSIDFYQAFEFLMQDCVDAHPYYFI